MSHRSLKTIEMAELSMSHARSRTTSPAHSGIVCGCHVSIQSEIGLGDGRINQRFRRPRVLCWQISRTRSTTRFDWLRFDPVFLLLPDSPDHAGILFMLQSAIPRESAILRGNVRPMAISPIPLGSLLTAV